MPRGSPAIVKKGACRAQLNDHRDSHDDPGTVAQNPAGVSEARLVLRLVTTYIHTQYITYML